MEYHLAPSIPTLEFPRDRLSPLRSFLSKSTTFQTCPPIQSIVAQMTSPYITPLHRIRTVQTLPHQLIWTYADLKTGDPKTLLTSMQWKLSVALFLGASIETSQTYHSILTHWNSLIKFQCWASLEGLTFLGMTISQPQLKLQRASVVSYLGLEAISLPVRFLHCIRLKFVSVSNMALICGEGPPSILLPHRMQFRSEQLN